MKILCLEWSVGNTIAVLYNTAMVASQKDKNCTEQLDYEPFEDKLDSIPKEWKRTNYTLVSQTHANIH